MRARLAGLLEAAGVGAGGPGRRVTLVRGRCLGPTSRILRDRWRPLNATTTRSWASSAARPTPSSSAPSASSPSSGTRTSTPTPEAQERFKEINEAYQVLSDPQARQRYDMFGAAGVNGGAGAAGAGFERLRRLQRHLRCVLRRGRRRQRGAARSAAARRGPALRPAADVRGGDQRHREGDRVPGPPALRDVQGEWRQGRASSRSPARSATAAARSAASARRCSARWSTSAPARAARARARSSRRPCETCKGDGRTEQQAARCG